MTDNDQEMTKSSYKDFIYRSCDQDILFKITEHSYLGKSILGKRERIWSEQTHVFNRSAITLALLINTLNL